MKELSTIEEVRGFKTTDEKLFETKKEAEKHQMEIDLMELIDYNRIDGIDEDTYTFIFDNKEIDEDTYTFILDNKEILKKIIEKL